MEMERSHNLRKEETWKMKEKYGSYYLRGNNPPRFLQDIPWSNFNDTTAKQ